MALKKRQSELSSLEKFNLYYRQPEKLTTKESFKRFLWNPKTREVFGRTASSWSKIILFYTVFYGVLAALVAICMWVFFQTLDPRTPTWRLERSIIGTNPGLGFRPLPPAHEVESTLIYYKGSEKENFKYWTDSLTEFLRVYKTPGLLPGQGQNIYTCSFDAYPPKGQVCEVSVKDLGPCTEENFFSYHKSAPCIFLKLNKIYSWVPEYFNNTQELPSKMPQQLKSYIAGESARNVKYLNTVWVSCEGENPADVENIGTVKYFPRQGFPGFYYPYENTEGYLSPIVAVHLERPRTGILINIECKAWAKNIRHDRHDRLGSVHLEIMID